MTPLFLTTVDYIVVENNIGNGLLFFARLFFFPSMNIFSCVVLLLFPAAGGTQVNRIIAQRNNCIEPVRGMTNLGNSCYLNAALQVMVNSDPFIRYLSEGDHPVAAALKELVTQYKSGASTVVSPAAVLSALIELDPTLFRKLRMGDSHEAVSAILSVMGERVRRLFSFSMRTSKQCIECGGSGTDPDRVEIMQELIVPLLSAEVSLEEVVNKMTHTVEVVDKIECETCGASTTHRIFRNIDIDPQLLLIVLSRYNPDGSKLNVLVQYPQRLRIGEKGEDYVLTGTVHHVGGRRESGHYYAELYGVDSPAACLVDDATVSKIETASQYASDTVYILLYQKGS